MYSQNIITQTYVNLMTRQKTDNLTIWLDKAWQFDDDSWRLDLTRLDESLTDDIIDNLLTSNSKFTKNIYFPIEMVKIDLY